MATNTTSTTENLREKGGDVVDLTKQEARTAATRAEEAVQEAGLTLSDVGYAALGVGDVAVEAARSLGTQLPGLLRRAPSALSTNLTQTYVMLAARGRRLRGQIESDEATSTAQEQTKAAVSQAKGAATTAREGTRKAAEQAGTGAQKAADRASTGVDEVTEQAEKTAATTRKHAKKTAATTREQGEKTTSRAKGAATSASKAAEKQADATRSAAEKVGSGAASDPLEEKTVEELRDRASDLEIEGRTNMRKKELIKAIREAE
jgi:hypothetical protein